MDWQVRTWTYRTVKKIKRGDFYYYFWGYFKSRGYFNRHNNIDDFKERIRNEIRLIQPGSLNRLMKEFVSRPELDILTMIGFFLDSKMNVRYKWFSTSA